MDTYEIDGGIICCFHCDSMLSQEEIDSQRCRRCFKGQLHSKTFHYAVVSAELFVRQNYPMAERNKEFIFIYVNAHMNYTLNLL